MQSHRTSNRTAAATLAASAVGIALAAVVVIADPFGPRIEIDALFSEAATLEAEDAVFEAQIGSELDALQALAE